MIGIVIPAHNEQAYLDACLRAVTVAARHPALAGEAVHITVVLDDCDDASAAIVARHAAHCATHRPAHCSTQCSAHCSTQCPAHCLTHCSAHRVADCAAQCAAQCAAGRDDLAGPRINSIAVAARNVGVARAAGAAAMVAAGARWLAFTDADTRVAPGWLAAQLSLDADVVCGTVAVDDWSPHQKNSIALREHFARNYTDADGHRHIHGANLGVSAAAYARAGGFEPLACSEDVALVDALQRSGARFAWSAAPRVATSARRDAKARGGFGDTLLRYVAALHAPATPIVLQD